MKQFAMALAAWLLMGSALGSEVAVRGLHLPALEGFEQQPEPGQHVHFRNPAGVELSITVLSMSAESEAAKFGGDAERRLKFSEATATKMYESSVQGGERSAPMRREALASGSTLFSGAVEHVTRQTKTFLLEFVLLAPRERIAVVTLEGEGPALEAYRQYRPAFDSATWQDDPDLAEAVAFTDRVATQLRARQANTQVTVRGPLTLTVGELQANLDRIFSFCQRDAAGCKAETDRYLDGVVETLQSAHKPLERDAVRLIARTRTIYERASANMGGKVGLAPRALAGELVLIPAVDAKTTIQWLSRSGAKDLGLSDDEIFALGASNLKKTLRPLTDVAKPVGKAAIASLPPDSYNSGRLALLDSWSPLAQAQGGVLIVAAPANDTLLYISEDTPTAVDALRTLASTTAAAAAGPLSKELLRWTPGGWELVP